MSPGPTGTVVVACVQMRPQLGDVAGNLARSAQWIRTAAAAGARLVVLPEAASAGYMFADRAEALRYAEPVPDGPTCAGWAEICAELDVFVVGGLTERAGDDIYNAAVLIGPSGHIGSYRKVHLWNDEKAIYGPGDLGFPVFDTPLGRIGVLICYDAWFPESFRSCALAGADIVCSPSNWVPVPGQPTGTPPMANLMCMTGAHSNQVYVAAASRVGVERDQPFIGASVIVDHTGWVLAGPADGEQEQLLLAEVDLVGSRPDRHGNPFNQPLADRRPPAYLLEERS